MNRACNAINDKIRPTCVTGPETEAAKKATPIERTPKNTTETQIEVIESRDY